MYLPDVWASLRRPHFVVQCIGMLLSPLMGEVVPVGKDVPMKRRLVVLESPYAGDVVKNIAYARACMRDCLLRGEQPFASHLLYTQEGILDDGVPEERTLGIEAGFQWGRHADAVVVYTDLGISHGMQLGVQRAQKNGKTIEYRTLGAWKQ